MSTRFVKCSGRTSFAIAAKSSGFLMSCLGKAMPPFGHSLTAWSMASSSVGAHETWIWSSLGVPSGPCPPHGALVTLGPQHPDLLVRGAHGDHAVREPAGLPGVDRTGRGDVDRDAVRIVRTGVELGALEREVLPLVLDDVAAEQLVDDLDGLEHHRGADADLRPLAADDVLVERLARAQSQPEAPREHGTQRGRRMGDDRRVIAEAGARHRRPEPEAGARCPGPP